MKLQILCICSDHLVIKRTVSTWINQVDRIVILANGPNRQLIKDSLKCFENVFVIIGEFEGFSETKNKLINLAQCKKYDYNIFLDDSYEVIGLLRQALANETCNKLALNVITGTFTQCRRLIFKTGKFVGKIHETLDGEKESKVVECVFIKDVVYEHHLQRSIDRAEYDLEMLKGDHSRRGTYYKFITLFKIGRVEEAEKLLKSLLSINDEYSGMIKKILVFN